MYICIRQTFESIKKPFERAHECVCSDVCLYIRFPIDWRSHSPPGPVPVHDMHRYIGIYTRGSTTAVTVVIIMIYNKRGDTSLCPARWMCSYTAHAYYTRAEKTREGPTFKKLYILHCLTISYYYIVLSWNMTIVCGALDDRALLRVN